MYQKIISRPKHSLTSIYAATVLSTQLSMLQERYTDAINILVLSTEWHFTRDSWLKFKTTKDKMASK